MSFYEKLGVSVILYNLLTKEKNIIKIHSEQN